MLKVGFFKHRSRHRAGDWVEVKSAQEIMATLDEKGRLERLPFMPEMLQYCGRRFRISKIAHKTCDTIKTYHNRRITSSVHLEGLRCDGEAHGGCEAGCLLFWKEAWLQPISRRNLPAVWTKQAPPIPSSGKIPSSDYKQVALALNTKKRALEKDSTAERYRCQATEIFKASTPLHWWDPRQYVRDLSSGNIQLHNFILAAVIALRNMVTRRLHWRLRTYPYMPGRARMKTPTEVLNLQPGELVEVRSKKEIMQTINAERKNRGLAFDVEMFAYCGRRFRVLRRVEKIINDRTGSMIRIPTACFILDGVTCGGCRSRNRLFCPRSIYPYWHEIWLKRVGEIKRPESIIASYTGNPVGHCAKLHADTSAPVKATQSQR